MGAFYFTQTSIKDLEKEETCPWRWKEQWLEGNVPFKSNEAMDKGKYFEQLILGSGAIAGDEVLDLPRLQNGAKSAEHQRIDAQVERAKRIIFDPSDKEFLGFFNIKAQLELKHTNRKGTIDFECVDIDKYPWLIDLKLTTDLTSSRTKYGWGNDWSDLDLLQMAHYQDLYFNLIGIRPKMALLVFDFSPQKRVMFGEIVISEEKRAEKELRFNSAEETLSLYNKHGWVKIPNIKECEACPLKCNERIQGSQIIKKTIMY